MDEVPERVQELVDAFEHPDPSDWGVGSAEVGWGTVEPDAWSEVAEAEEPATPTAA